MAWETAEGAAVAVEVKVRVGEARGMDADEEVACVVELLVVVVLLMAGAETRSCSA